MSRKVCLMLLGLTLAFASWAWGQPAHEFVGSGSQDRLIEIKRSQLGSVLGVDQQTVNKLLTIDEQYKPIRRQMIMGMKTDFQRLQQLLSQPSPSEQEIKAVLSDMKRKRLEMLNLQQRKDEEEMAILTPVQQARYIIYLMGLVREARTIKGGPGGPGGPGGMRPLQPPREIPVSRPPQ
ncbi:MAG: Spy/CpxP family protein refolding chaperone [Thermodesulfobacteriota bacterium]